VRHSEPGCFARNPLCDKAVLYLRGFHINYIFILRELIRSDGLFFVELRFTTSHSRKKWYKAKTIHRQYHSEDIISSFMQTEKERFLAEQRARNDKIKNDTRFLHHDLEDLAFEEAFAVEIVVGFEFVYGETGIVLGYAPEGVS